MLTYRLTGTTDDIGVDHDEPHHGPPPANATATANGAESSHPMVRLAAALLTCGNSGTRQASAVSTTLIDLII